MLPQLALDGTPSPAVSVWVLAVFALCGVFLAFGITKLAAHRTAPAASTVTAGTAITDFFTQRLGRRGTLLMMYGAGYGLYGFGQFRNGPTTRFGNLGPLTGMLNSHVTGWLFILGGVIGVAISLRPRRENDGAGFIAVFIPLLAWVGLYAASWAVGVVTHDVAGNSGAWVTCSVWAILAGTVLVTAGWPDPRMTGGDRE